MLNKTIKSSISIEIKKDIKPNTSILAFNILGKTLMSIHANGLHQIKTLRELEMDVK